MYHIFYRGIMLKLNTCMYHIFYRWIMLILCILHMYFREIMQLWLIICYNRCCLIFGETTVPLTETLESLKYERDLRRTFNWNYSQYSEKEIWWEKIPKMEMEIVAGGLGLGDVCVCVCVCGAYSGARAKCAKWPQKNIIVMAKTVVFLKTHGDANNQRMQ